MPDHSNVSSGIKKELSFDKKNWLIHIINAGPWLGGHSALLIEALTSDNMVCLIRYEIFATNYKTTLSGRSGCISNVVIRQAYADKNDQAALKKLYESKIVKRSGGAATWKTAASSVDVIYHAVMADMLKTARGVAKAFLLAEEEGPAYFQKTELLAKYKVELESPDGGEEKKVVYPFAPRIFGQTPFTVFMNYCERIFDELLGAERVLERPMNEQEIRRFTHQILNAGKFLKTLNSSTLRPFLNNNLEKLHKDKYIAKLNSEGHPLLPFRITGPTVHFHAEAKADRDQDETVNCTQWCRDKLMKIDIETDFKNKPKKASGGCVLF